MLSNTLRQAARATCRRRAVPSLTTRTFASSGSDKESLPFGLGKILGGTEPDNLIPTDIERKTKEGHIPDFATPEIKKDLEELGLSGIEELDELEEKNMEGYNELGLVPPEGAGSFAR